MPSSRIGFGYGDYSDADFGVEGVLQESSASISATATVTVSGGRSEDGSASLSATSSLTANGVATLVGTPAEIASTSSLADVSADKIIDGSASITSDSGNLYGYGAYGSSDYGKTTVFAVRIRESSGTSSGSATFTSAGVRIQQPSAQIDAVASLSADSDTIVNGQAVLSGLSSIESSGLRIRETNAQITTQAGLVINAREKWEPLPKGSEIWTEIA
jgi:hypothetical protein